MVLELTPFELQDPQRRLQKIAASLGVAVPHSVLCPSDAVVRMCRNAAVEVPPLLYSSPLILANAIVSGSLSEGGGDESMTGQVLISSVTVTTPVEWIDIALPSGYAYFTLTLTGMKHDVGMIAGAVSYDNGATFESDLTNSDTYRNVISYTTGSIVESLSDPYPLFYISLVPSLPSGGYSTMSLVTIDVGSSDSSCVLFSNVAQIQDNHTGHVMSYLVDGATAFASYNRVNFMRLVVDGNGDIDPPTAGKRFRAGTFKLFGVS